MPARIRAARGPRSRPVGPKPIAGRSIRRGAGEARMAGPRPGSVDRARQRPGRPVRPRRRPRGVDLRLPARRHNGAGQPARAGWATDRRRQRARRRRRPGRAGPAPRDLLAVRGFSGRAFVAAQAARGTTGSPRAEKHQRSSMPPGRGKSSPNGATRIEPIFREIADRRNSPATALTASGACVIRTAATIAARPLRTCLTEV